MRIQSKYIFYFTIFTILILVSSQAGEWDLQNCIYKDYASGKSYDLKGLSKSTYWRLKDKNGDSGLFSMDYLFNFCKPISTQCKGQNAGAYEALEVLGQITDTCEILGKQDQQLIELQNPSDPVSGIKLTYNGGDICQNSENPSENGKPRSVKFKLNCRESQDSDFQQSKINSITITKCNMEFTFNTPSACPIGYLSGSSSTTILLWVIFIAACYFGLGSLYNQKYKQLKGIESLPNLEFWKQVPGYIKDGMQFSFYKVRQMSGLVISSVSKIQKGQQENNGQGYDTV